MLASMNSAGLPTTIGSFLVQPVQQPSLHRQLLWQRVKACYSGLSYHVPTDAEVYRQGHIHHMKPH